MSSFHSSTANHLLKQHKNNRPHNHTTNTTTGDIPILSLKNSLSQISFCDRECYNINNDYTKESIINYVQNRHKIRIIDRQYVTLDPNKIRNISHHEHLVATYSNGNPYLLLLTRIDDSPCCIFIDRKCKPGYNYPKMHAVEYKFSQHLFNKDTLFTGELIRDINREWQFIISDLLVYEGESTRNQNILTRFEIINNILDKHYLSDPSQEICPIFCKRLFQYQQLSYLFNEFMPSLSYVCKGLVFYTLNNRFSNYCWVMPRDHQISVKRKHEYLETTNDTAAVYPAIPIPTHAQQHIPELNHLSVTTAPDTSTNNVSSTQILPRFKIIKTGTPDIYHLFTATNTVDRVCVAFIPDLATSQWLYKHFVNNNDKALKTVVECKYHPEFDKWVPIAICRDDVSSHSLDEFPDGLAVLAQPGGNSPIDVIEKIKSNADLAYAMYI